MERLKKFFGNLCRVLREMFRPVEPSVGYGTTRPLVAAGKKRGVFLHGNTECAVSAMRRTNFHRDEDGTIFSVEVSWIDALEFATGGSSQKDFCVEKSVWYPNEAACLAAMTDPQIGGLSLQAAEAAIRKSRLDRNAILR